MTAMRTLRVAPGEWLFAFTVERGDLIAVELPRTPVWFIEDAAGGDDPEPAREPSFREGVLYAVTAGGEVWEIDPATAVAVPGPAGSAAVL